MKPLQQTIVPLSASAPDGSSKSGRVRGFLFFALGLSAAFSFPLGRTMLFVSTAQYYSHTLLIPVISAYLIAQKRNSLSDFKTSILPSAIFTVIGVLALAFALVQSPSPFPADRHAPWVLSFLSFLGAGVSLFLGSTVLRAIAFPAAFLVFMIPMPHALIEHFQIWLQHASAEAAYWMLSLTSIPMIRDGVDFHFPGIDIRVAEECSGFNSSLVLFIVSFLAGYLFLNRTRNRIALILFVIPLAILRNGFRISVISMLCVYVGPHMIDSPIHHRGGPVFFALSLIPFTGLIWLFRRSEAKVVTPDSNPDAQ